MNNWTSHSENNDRILDWSTGGLLPCWAEALVKLGFIFARDIELYPLSHATLAISLPRIEFAALFIALGVLKWKAGKGAQQEGVDKLRSMLGTWVSYESNGITRVGRLDYVPQSADYCIKILEFKGRKLPNFEELSFEARKNYNPPKSGGLWHFVTPPFWPTVKPVGREFNEERGARADQVKRIASAARNSEVTEKIVGPGRQHWLMTSREKPVCIFGSKSRLAEELYENISLARSSDKFRLSDLLRPVGANEYAASSHVLIGSCANMAQVDSETICVIEAGRLLEDNLRSSSGNNRVVLLAHSVPSYEQTAHIVKNAYFRRMADFVLEFGYRLTHIETLSFSHK
jgi:hypothetical protein